jgi:hypothetical protein
MAIDKEDDGEERNVAVEPEGRRGGERRDSDEDTERSRSEYMLVCVV